MVNIHRVNVQFELNVSSNPMRSFQTHTLNILNTALMGRKNACFFWAEEGESGEGGRRQVPNPWRTFEEIYMKQIRLIYI